MKVRIQPIARAAAVLAATVLVALGIAYYLTYEPAPEIRVRWRPGLPLERQAQLERQFMLVNRKPSEDRFTYDLLDTSRRNVEALVHERDIADTDRVDREGFTIPPDIPYGDSWMWIGYRVAVLRTTGVVEAIIVTCAVVLAAATALLFKERRKSAHVDVGTAP